MVRHMFGGVLMGFGGVLADMRLFPVAQKKTWPSFDRQ
jgi:hypothetical protein